MRNRERVQALFVFKREEGEEANVGKNEQNCRNGDRVDLVLGPMGRVLVGPSHNQNRSLLE